jgi:hypothetical protein
MGDLPLVTVLATDAMQIRTCAFAAPLERMVIDILTGQ